MVSMALHNACQVLIQQWRYGAAGIKPTTIRCVNLGQRMAHELHSAAIPGLVRPSVVLAGYDETKSYRTAAAKEYPEGLCCALIRSALAGLSSRRDEGWREISFAQLEERDRLWLHLMSALGTHVQDTTYLPDYQPKTG